MRKLVCFFALFLPCFLPANEEISLQKKMKAEDSEEFMHHYITANDFVGFKSGKFYVAFRVNDKILGEQAVLVSRLRADDGGVFFLEQDITGYMPVSCICRSSPSENCELEEEENEIDYRVPEVYKKPFVEEIGPTGMAYELNPVLKECSK